MDFKNDEIEIDLQEIFMYLLNKCWVMIVSMLLCAAIAFGYTSQFITPMYQSDAMIFVNGASSVTGLDFSISVSDLDSGADLINTYQVILETRTTLSEIIEYVGCDYSTSELKSMISVSSVNSTSVFQVVVTNSDPVMAESIATAITKILPEKISDIIDGTSVKVIDTAILPSTPYTPDYTKNVAMGALIGVVISAAILVLLKLLEKKITSVDYIKSTYSDIPLLGVIPVIGSSKKKY